MLSSSENYERWKRGGAADANARATKVYRSTLDSYEQPPLDEAIRAELGEYVVRLRTELAIDQGDRPEKPVRGCTPGRRNLQSMTGYWGPGCPSCSLR